MQTISYANYDVAKMTPFQIVTLAKDELLRRDHTDYSILVFVLKGTVRVSTSVYVKDNVENGNMFVVHEHDYICVRGGVESVLLFCYFDSSMALCNGLSLRPATEKSSSAIISGTLTENHIPVLPIRNILMMELAVTQNEMDGSLFGGRFFEYKRYVILLVIRAVYSNEDLLYLFRIEPGDIFEFRELFFKYYNFDMNVKELAVMMNIPRATFNRKFKRAFGLPAGEWLNLKRKSNVLMDLKTTDMTVKEIADKYKLSPNYLTSFCKKYLGDTPLNIRETND